MKKSISIISLILIIGLGNLFSQETPMQKDSMKTSGKKMAKNKDDKIAMGKGSKMPAGEDNKMAMDKDPQKAMDKEHKMGMGKENKMTAGEDNKMAMDKDHKMGMDNKTMMMPDVNSWPTASKMAVEEITSKYGKPDGITPEELIWMNKGVWKKICIDKKESKHSFPVEHTDMMQQTISHKVPEDKMDDLGKFDGSVTFDRTQGTLSARCDVEANNFLALNLAHDIITGKKTTEQAREAFANIVKEKMNGGNPEYMQKLSFTPEENAADPDKNTTGLTKEDVMNGMKKASGK